MRNTTALAMLALAASCSSHEPSVTNASPRGALVELGLPENRLARWQSMTVLSDTVFVASNVFPVRGDSLDPRPAYISRLRLSARGDLIPLAPLELPPGDFQFAYPRIVSANGKLHMVWAEFSSPPRTPVAWNQATAAFETSLWHAVRDTGAWSPPERVATARWFGWNDETGGVAVDATGALHIAVWAGDSIPRVRHLRLASGQWETSRLPYTSVNQSTAIATHGDTVVIAVVDATSGTQRVVLVESADQGRHWINPIVVSQRTTGFVTALALASTADGQLLAIGEKPPDSFYVDTIRLVRVNRTTGSSITQLVAPPPGSAAFVLAAAPCGSDVMLIRTFTLNPRIFELRIARDSSPSLIGALPSDSGIAVYPGLIAGRRSVIAVFGYTPAVGTPARTFAMTLAGCSL